MARYVRPVRLGLFAGLVLLVFAGASEAQYRGLGGRLARRSVVYPNNRMPGWDWWRTYPWSPYNYGRNPYNPIVYPYVYPYPEYYPMPLVDEAPSYYSYGQSLPLVGSGASPTVPLPSPTGGGTVPPPDGAVVELMIPDQFGTVTFDGAKTSSIGTTRYYVTPSLPGDKSLSYAVTATFRRNGETVTEERNVKVSPGQTSVVDFNKPAKAQ